MKFYVVSFISLLISVSVYAETTYTKLEDTIVRDKPVALGSTILAHLKAGSMIETTKRIGAFTTVSFIMDGKVRTGFIASSQLSQDLNHRPTAAEAAQTAVGAADVASMVNGLSDTPSVSGVAGGPQDVMTVPEDLQATQIAKLDQLTITPAAVAEFARSGQLVGRKAKSK